MIRVIIGTTILDEKVDVCQQIPDRKRPDLLWPEMSEPYLMSLAQGDRIYLKDGRHLEVLSKAYLAERLELYIFTREC